MNDEEEELKVKDSKCNTCKHGLCALDNDIQSFFAPGTTEENVFTGEGPQASLTETQFPIKKVRSMCFWTPAGKSTMSPVVFACVTECGRYEKRQD